MKRLVRIAAAAATALVAAAALSLFGQGSPAAALGAPDTTPPDGSVSGVRNPASGTLELRLYASDEGWGLASAEASIDEGVRAFARLGKGSCPEHPTPDEPEPTPGDCPEAVSAVPMSLDTQPVPDGSHRLVVRVTDAAANTATVVDEEIVVRNAARAMGTKATATVGVTSQGPAEQFGGGRPPSPPGRQRRRCRVPKLKMRLASRPLWYTRPHHVPVLRYGRRYPYRGKLTCLTPSGKRVPAPKGTPVEVYYRVWRLSFKRPRGPVRYVRIRELAVGRKGRLRVGLGFKSGRTILFRYHGPDGELAKSKLRVAVPPRTRRPPWGPR
jgi:hypothetical protein